MVQQCFFLSSTRKTLLDCLQSLLEGTNIVCLLRFFKPWSGNSVKACLVTTHSPTSCADLGDNVQYDVQSAATIALGEPCDNESFNLPTWKQCSDWRDLGIVSSTWNAQVLDHFWIHAHVVTNYIMLSSGFWSGSFAQAVICGCLSRSAC